MFRRINKEKLIVYDSVMVSAIHEIISAVHIAIEAYHTHLTPENIAILNAIIKIPKTTSQT